MKQKLTTEITELKTENKKNNDKITTINNEKKEIQTAFEKAIACEEKHKERVNTFQLISCLFLIIKFQCHYLFIQSGFSIGRFSQ